MFGFFGFFLPHYANAVRAVGGVTVISVSDKESMWSAEQGALYLEIPSNLFFPQQCPTYQMEIIFHSP